MKRPQNPYRAGSVLTEDEYFFGREDIVSQVNKELRNKGTKVLVLFGQRRIGKSSLLRKLYRKLPSEQYLTIYFDLQDRSQDPMSVVLADLADITANRAQVPELAKGEFDDDGKFFSQFFLPKLLDILANRRLVFFFDEFDVIDQSNLENISRNAASKRFFNFIQTIMDQDDRFAFVFALGRDIGDLSQKSKAIFKSALQIPVWVLDKDSATKLILQAEENATLTYTPDAIEQILSLTNCHPYMAQLLCQRIWESAYSFYDDSPHENFKLPIIDAETVKAVVPNTIQVGNHAFDWLWDGLSPAEKIYASAFAETTEKGNVITREQVNRVIQENAARLNFTEMDKAAEFLRKRHIIVESDKGDGYLFSIELFKIWIIKNKHLNDIKNTLDQTDPLADNMFRTGKALYDMGKKKEALSNLSNALAINANHYQARLVFAEMLLQNNDIDNSVIHFQKAYELDKVDARLPFLNALIIQAKAEYARGNDAVCLNICERILEIAITEKEIQQANELSERSRKRRELTLSRRGCTRPALIIGLGGTGQWILTFLKKNLLELGNGQMPPGVKLLCFDTTSSSVAKVGQTEDGRQSETEIKLGSVKLEDGIEFIPIGGNVYELAQDIRRGQENPEQQMHPHIASWFDAKEMLQRHSRATFNLAESAGQVRQFGRLALFNDILQGPKSKIRSHIRAAVADLRKEVSERRQMEIIIVASFAGGTGAGMFVDTAVLARKIASEQVQKDLCVRGFYVLPRVFTTQDSNMQARSFAAWRELDRFLMIGEKFGQRKIIYHPTDPGLQIDINERIFDVCYLVDAVSGGLNSLENLPPDKGLFPMVSDIISTILDNKAGQVYTEYVTANLAGKLELLPRAPYHSAIGAYTIKVPVYYALQVYAHQYALDILDRLLRPVKNLQKYQITGVSASSNDEKPNTTCRKSALEFLRARSSADFGLVGDERVNTSFTHIVADINERDAVSDGVLIGRVATMQLGGAAGEANQYFGSLANVGDDEKGKKLLKEVQEELNLLLLRAVPPSRVAKDTPANAFPRIKSKTQDFIIEHYGMKRSDGTEQRGKYGDALHRCQEFQIERFQEMLYLWLKATLNGTSDDPERAKSGKIGYAREVLADVAMALGYYIEYFGKVRHERTERLAKLSIEAAADQALRQYQLQKDKKSWLTVWKAHKTQLTYLQAAQRIIDNRKYDILINVLMETADQMRAIIKTVGDELDIWIKYLATGDTERQLAGLYSEVQNSLDLAKSNHFDEIQREKVQRVLGDLQYETDAVKIKELLSRFEWKVNLTANALTIGLQVAIPKIGEQSMMIREFRCSGKDATDFNLKTILSLGEAQYADIPEQSPVSLAVLNEFSTPEKLVNTVEKRFEPLFRESTLSWEPHSISSSISIDTDNLTLGRQEVNSFIDKFVQRLRELDPHNEVRVLPSNDRYRMTLLRSYDLLLSEQFELWHMCKKAYEEKIVTQRVSSERFQVFPAERNAAAYEQEISYLLKKGGEYKILHPNVVGLLEDRIWFEYFFLSVAYGLIRKERISSQDVYLLELPDSPEPFYLSRTSEYTQRQPDLLDVIDVFVNRRAAIDNPQRWIDLAEIKSIIRLRMEMIGASGSKERLLFQVDNPTGVVGVLREKVKNERNKPDIQPAVKSFIAAEYDDLADLATVIYKRTILNLGI